MSEDAEIRAARAEQLLEDEVLQKALDGVTSDALLKAGMASLSDASECIAAIAALQAAASFNGKLREFVTAGKPTGRNKIYVA
jgi:hypothetical protein